MCSSAAAAWDKLADMGESRRGFVTIVSGVPRSGTSLLMQMLVAGGLPALRDDLRPADVHNPRGYFEYAPVKRLEQDSTWVAAGAGHALKVMYRLVPALPPGLEYRVLLAHRDLREVVASQQAMLGDEAEASLPAARLAEVFAAQLAELEGWLAGQPQFRRLDVFHDRLLSEPRGVAEAIDRFLDGGLDTAAMAAAVVPELWRVRAGRSC